MPPDPGRNSTFAIQVCRVQEDRQIFRGVAGEPRWRGFSTGLESIVGGAEEESAGAHHVPLALRSDACERVIDVLL